MSQSEEFRAGMFAGVHAAIAWHRSAKEALEGARYPKARVEREARYQQISHHTASIAGLEGLFDTPIDSPNEAQRLLLAAVEEGHRIVVQYDGETEPDYEGYCADKAWEAIAACEEMGVAFYDQANNRLGVALIIPGLAADEVVADCSGDWVEKVLEGAGHDEA